jgi:hypothetical protein
LSFQTLKQFDRGGQEAIAAMVQSKAELIRQFPTYSKLVSGGNENMLLGLSFEEIMAGRIVHSAAKQGISLERIQGKHGGLHEELWY